MEGGNLESRQNADHWAPRPEGRAGPIYLAVADALAEGVRSGELRGGDRLPTHRALADALGVDLTTVTRAYAEARRRGLLDATVGRGTFVRGRQELEPRRRAEGLGAVDFTGVVDLSMNL